MLSQLLRRAVENYHGRFNALIDITGSIRRRENYNARETFLGEAIYAVVIVLVEHPKLKFFNKMLPLLALLPSIHAQLDWRIIKNHV